MASINYTVADNWGSGFVGNMTVSGFATSAGDFDFTSGMVVPV